MEHDKTLTRMFCAVSLSHIQVVAVPWHKVAEMEGASLQPLLSQSGVPDIQLKTARLSIPGMEFDHKFLVPSSYPVGVSMKVVLSCCFSIVDTIRVHISYKELVPAALWLV